MSSVSTAARNNMLAGSFLIISLILAVVVSIVLAGLEDRLTPTNAYVVRFSLADGATGLQSGSEVRLGGQQIGRVSRVRFASSEGTSGRSIPNAVEVDVKVRSDLELYENATVLLELPLLGSLSTINIIDTGIAASVTQPQGSGPELENGEWIQGRIAPPAFLAQAGFGPEQSNQVQQIITDTTSIVDRLERTVSTVEEQINPTLTTARTVAEDVQSVTSSLRENWPSWSGDIDAGLSATRVFAEELGQLEDSILARLDTIDDMMRSVQDVIDANAPKINRSFDHMESILATADTETMTLVSDALERGTAGIDEFVELGERANTTFAEHTPSIRRSMANARLASDQLKLLAVEVRSQPWRLLQRPSTKELESQLLYDSARTYAQAVSDLRAASESLETTAGAETTLAIDRETLEDLRRRIDEAFERYQAAERDLLDRLISAAP